MYDLQFKLFDALAGGTQVGLTNSPTNGSVSGGIFTVTLDFGATAFSGADRWLEISARLAGGGSFTTLSPRQPVTSTPYTTKSLNAATADALSAACSGCVTNARIADGSVTNAKIADVAGSKITGSITAATIPGANVSGTVANATTAVNFTGPLAGDVTGTQTATNVVGLRGKAIAAAAATPANGQVLKFKRHRQRRYRNRCTGG